MAKLLRMISSSYGRSTTGDAIEHAFGLLREVVVRRLLPEAGIDTRQAA